MDLNPTFGRKDWMETLSQNSLGTSSNRSGERRLPNNARPNSSVVSNSSDNRHNTAMSVASSHVDEAVRRLGRRLSLQAHGGDASSVTSQQNNNQFRYSNEKSSFFRFHRGESSKPGTHDPWRTLKVAKTGYADHGEHHLSQNKSNSIVRKLTYECRERFQKWEGDRQQQFAAAAAAGYTSNHQPRLSPQRYAFSQLALGSSSNRHQSSQYPQQHQQQNSADHLGDSTVGSHGSWNQQHYRSGGVLAAASKGLLSAVLEGHSDSASLASHSISTKGSRTAISSQGGGPQPGASTAPQTPRGRCLTMPADAVANGGLDNSEGNLIVYENDTILVSRRNVRTIRKADLDDRLRSAEYRVQEIQGQGTFAQVFKCLHIQTGQHVALKIVKNKPAYTRQAAIEIDIFQTLQEDDRIQQQNSSIAEQAYSSVWSDRDYMVNLISYFMHQNHLCLVFELLGLNLYEVLKRRQFRGLPLTVVRSIIRQSVEGIRDLSRKNVVHCDLKPENILLVSEDVNKYVIGAGDTKCKREDRVDFPLSSNGSVSNSKGDSSSGSTTQASNGQATGVPSCKIKLIDFGSACFEGYTAHTYIQSRFYRSPEVLIGLPYDSAIDMWSLGCVAAELFLGLPILPGVHEYDQVGRIIEMIAKIPDWMLDQGSKSTKYYVKFVSRPNPEQQSSPSNPRTPSPGNMTGGSPAPVLPQWRIKTQQEYVESLSPSEIRKKGGLAKLKKQPGNRYFKSTKLADIVVHAQSSIGEDRNLVQAFVHFLYGILDPDPRKRFTAFQAAQHPFVTGDLSLLQVKSDNMDLNSKEENQANLELEVYWPSPWDPALCRRKLLTVQRMREKQQAMRRGMSSRPHGYGRSPMDLSVTGSDRLRTRRGDTASLLEDQADIRVSDQQADGSSPPNQISSSGSTSAGGYMASSSWSGLGQIEMRAQLVGGNSSIVGHDVLAPLSHPMVSGPQSFQGIAHTPTEEDFAHALQRPGVVPGTFVLGSSMTSQSTSASYLQSTSAQSTPYGSSPYIQHNTHQLPSNHDMVNVGFSNGISQSESSPGGDEEKPCRQNILGTIRSPGHSQASGRDLSSYVCQFQNESLLSSHNDNTIATRLSGAHSGFSLPDVPLVDPYQFALFQQHQHNGLFHQPPQYHPQQHEQYPQFAQPQQLPVMLAGTPEGGYYYVTRTATGQSIVLQPVGLLSQQGGHPLMNQAAGQHTLAAQTGETLAYAPQQLNVQLNHQQGRESQYPGGYYNMHHEMINQVQPSQHQFPPSSSNSTHRYPRGGTSM